MTREERERASRIFVERIEREMAKRKGQRNIIGKIRVMIRQELGPVHFGKARLIMHTPHVHYSSALRAV